MLSPKGFPSRQRFGRPASSAIKIVRLERDVELKEAKDQVDAYLKGQPALQHRLEAAQAQATQTLVWWLIGLLMLAAAAAYVYVSGS